MIGTESLFDTDCKACGKTITFEGMQTAQMIAVRNTAGWYVAVGPFHENCKITKEIIKDYKGMQHEY